MFVSVVDDGPLHVVCNDDGSEFGERYPNRFSALAALRSLYIQRAKQHELDIDGGDLRYVHDLNGFTIDGAEPDEWIMMVCGCGEDGGTVEKHAGLDMTRSVLA